MIEYLLFVWLIVLLTDIGYVFCYYLCVGVICFVRNLVKWLVVVASYCVQLNVEVVVNCD